MKSSTNKTKKTSAHSQNAVITKEERTQYWHNIQQLTPVLNTTRSSATAEKQHCSHDELQSA